MLFGHYVFFSLTFDRGQFIWASPWYYRAQCLSWLTSGPHGVGPASLWLLWWNGLRRYVLSWIQKKKPSLLFSACSATHLVEKQGQNNDLEVACCWYYGLVYSALNVWWLWTGIRRQSESGEDWNGPKPRARRRVQGTLFFDWHRAFVSVHFVWTTCLLVSACCRYTGCQHWEYSRMGSL